MPEEIEIGGVKFMIATEEERAQELGTEEMGRIIREVVMGVPPPETERPQAAAFRRKFTQEDLPILRRIPGATVFTPE